MAVQADVANSTQVETLFKAAKEAFGKQPHILAASAGIIDPKYPTISENAVEDFDRIFGVNTKGTFLYCQDAAKRLKRGGGGRIITFSSTLAVVFQPGFGAYTPSKAAIETMTKILAKELKGTHITANCVAPGPIATELFFSGMSKEDIEWATNLSPMGCLGEPKDVIPLVAFLARDSGEWVNGQVIRVHGSFA